MGPERWRLHRESPTAGNGGKLDGPSEGVNVIRSWRNLPLPQGAFSPSLSLPLKRASSPSGPLAPWCRTESQEPDPTSPLHTGSPSDSFQETVNRDRAWAAPTMSEPSGTSPGLHSWGLHRAGAHVPSTVRIGSLWIASQLRGDEIWLAHGRLAAGEPVPEIPGDAGEWSRWAAPGRTGELDIGPLPPDRPLVLRPEKPFHLLPGASARIYVRVPVWVQVRVAGATGPLLYEIPSMVLSDTWWGTFTEGELCYWLPINARRTAPQETILPDRIVCPVELLNQAKEDLPVEKILLPSQHLTVFAGQECLWSDEVKVRHRGDEGGSVVEMTGRPPAEAGDARLLASPRTTAARSFTARTFARIRGFPGLGLAS